jgi:glycosyltransferase involved in cell wall biosynthesis
MKTLQIGDDWIGEHAGGLARYYSELLRHLPSTGTQSQGLVVGSKDVSFDTRGEVIAFARHSDPILLRMRKARSAAAAHLRAGGADLLATHFAPYALPLLDTMRSLPSVVHFHGPWAVESNREGASSWNTLAKFMVERLVYSHAHRLIVLSHCFQQELARRYGVSEEKIRVVPGGIDTERFRPGTSREEARRLLGWPLDRPVVLTVRRQVRRMGLEELVDAARLLVQRCPDVLLLIGGAGPLTAELHLRIAEHGLEDHVRLLGRIDETSLPLAYRAADLTVVPSQALEGFGLITLESLASGTPVYVTPIGGLPEVLGPFAPQCIFADASAEAIARGLADALTGSQPRPSEESCRQYAVQHFSWPAIARQVRDVYNEACR